MKRSLAIGCILAVLAGCTVKVKPTPPPPPPKRYCKRVWVPGHYNWRGVWVPGHWEWRCP